LKSLSIVNQTSSACNPLVFYNNGARFKGDDTFHYQVETLKVSIDIVTNQQ